MNRIVELRTSLNMTQDEFAEYCGVAKVSIARYEGGANVSRANAVKIAEACNVSIGFVLGIDINPQHVNTNEWNPDDMAWAEKADETTRLMARGMSKLSPENRQRLLDVARAMFKEDFDEEGNKL